MEELSVLACPREPPRDGRLTVAEDSFGRGGVQPFGQSREYHGDLVRGGFQPVQRRVVSSAERGAARLAAEGLDLLSLTMLAIPDERVDLRIGDAEVGALRVGTSEPFGVFAFGGSPSTFHLSPGTHRRSRWPSTRRASRAETTGGAIV